MPNSLIFCIPVKNCIINRTATLDRPQGLEPQNHFDPSLPCLPPKGRTSDFLASRSLILQCLNSLTATFSSVMLPSCFTEGCCAVLRSPQLPPAHAAGSPPCGPPSGRALEGPCGGTSESTLRRNVSSRPSGGSVLSFPQPRAWSHDCGGCCRRLFPSLWKGERFCPMATGLLSGAQPKPWLGLLSLDTLGILDIIGK